MRRCRPGYSLVESANHDDRVITDRENELDPERRMGRGEEMTYSRRGRWPEGSPTTCLVGIAMLLLATGCERGDAKASKQAPAGPTQTVLVVEVPQKTVSVGADFVARTEGVPTVEIRARVAGVRPRPSGVVPRPREICVG